MSPRGRTPSGPKGGIVDEAVEMYRRFQRLEPRRVDEFAAALEVPLWAKRCGRARHVLYRSGKVDPETLKRPRAPQNYIHEHDAGVCIYEPRRSQKREFVKVPDEIAEAFEAHGDPDRHAGLVLLGDCLGLAYDDEHGGTYELESRGRPPELYCVSTGKVLVVIEAKREILYLVWGGALGVEPRGIVG